MPETAENAGGARFIARQVWSFDGALEITVIVDTHKPIVQIAPRPRICPDCGSAMKTGAHNGAHNPFKRASNSKRPSTMKEAKFDREVQIRTEQIIKEAKRRFKKLGF